MHNGTLDLSLSLSFFLSLKSRIALQDRENCLAADKSPISFDGVLRGCLCGHRLALLI